MDRSKTALITGASRGLGRAIALSLASSGYDLAVNYRASEAEARDVASKAGGRSFAIRADVSDAASVLAMAAALKERFTHLDVLVNNAGISRDALLVKTTEDDWDAVLATNLKGCFNTVRALAPLMLDGAHIINVSSWSGLKGKPGQAAYSASKAALIGLTRTLARELGPDGIRVNALLPGYMPTGMGVAASDAMDAAMKASALGALCDPNEAARLVLWLVGTGSITGQLFTLDSRVA